MERIVVDCWENGCTRTPHWVIGPGLTSGQIRSCDVHLARITRRRLRLSGAPETIEIGEI